MNEKNVRIPFLSLSLIVFIAACGGVDGLLDKSLAAPSSIQAISGDGRVTLTWTAVTDAISYKIHYKVNSTTATVNDTLATDVTFDGASAVVLIPNGSYAFIVVALSSAGASVASLPAQATPTASPGTNSITLTGGLLADFVVSLELAANPAIAAADTSGAYPVYVIPRDRLPLTVSATITPYATSLIWLLDEVDLDENGTSLRLDSDELSARKHNLTLLLAAGTDP